MDNKRTLAIFDFCDTLIGMQTANRFVTLAFLSNKRFDTIINEFIRLIARKSRLLFGNRHKKWQLRQLKGLSREKLNIIANEYVKKELLPKENKLLVEKMLRHKKQGHDIAIVSGGFSEYIKEYAKIYDIDYVIATDLEFIDGKATGKIDGIDCMGINKIEKIRSIIDLDKYDLLNSFAYSDHISDIPLLSFVGNGIVVDFGEDIKWAKLMNYEVVNVK
ncbi:HAD family hydrolase [Aliarcobacter lanthieri]|uniref:HAD family hydrolase n=1 Tax=Aliarcobacter lanthieri TaxID=1355374 RepID=UPI003AFB023D